MRAVSADNPSLAKLKELFVRFSGCISTSQPTTQANGSSGSVVSMSIMRRDYIFLEFLRVAHEAVLLDMFSSFEEATQLTQFATFKFGEEVERE